MSFNEFRIVALIGYAVIFLMIGGMLFYRAHQSSSLRGVRVWLGSFLLFAAIKNADTAYVRIKYQPGFRDDHIADLDSTTVLVLGCLIGVVALWKLVRQDDPIGGCWDGETERRSLGERRKDWCR